MDADVSWGNPSTGVRTPIPSRTSSVGDAMTVMVSDELADHVDICEMFEAEVSLDYAVGKGWDIAVTVVFDETNRVVMWNDTTAQRGCTGTEKMFRRPGLVRRQPDAPRS